MLRFPLLLLFLFHRIIQVLLVDRRATSCGGSRSNQSTFRQTTCLRYSAYQCSFWNHIQWNNIFHRWILLFLSIKSKQFLSLKWMTNSIIISQGNHVTTTIQPTWVDWVVNAHSVIWVCQQIWRKSMLHWELIAQKGPYTFSAERPFGSMLNKKNIFRSIEWLIKCRINVKNTSFPSTFYLDSMRICTESNQIIRKIWTLVGKEFHV